MIVLVVVIMVVVVVVSHPAKLADLARSGGQFPTFQAASLGFCRKFGQLVPDPLRLGPCPPPKHADAAVS
jgi:hypothetical protein